MATLRPDNFEEQPLCCDLCAWCSVGACTLQGIGHISAEAKVIVCVLLITLSCSALLEASEPGGVTIATLCPLTPDPCCGMGFAHAYRNTSSLTLLVDTSCNITF
jgi:hypothetical protein